MLSTQPETKDDPVPNLELRGYAYALREWLEQAEDFLTFTQHITMELQRLGFSDWSYSRLDVPLPLSQPIGTLTGQYCDDDLMYQHLASSQSCIYRSTIAAFLDNSPVNTAALRHNRALLAQFGQQGYQDFIGIPINKNGKANHAVFTLTAKNKDSGYLKNSFAASEEKLRLLIELIETLGYSKYRKHFAGSKNTFDRICNGRPLKLLETMARNDYGIEQAAEAVNMSRTAADKQLARIRDYLGVKTTHAALFQALKLGLIRLDDERPRRAADDNHS